MRATIALLVAAAISQTHPAIGQFGSGAYLVYELPTGDLPDVHDGSIAEWEYLVPNASLTIYDFAQMVGITGTLGSDDLLSADDLAAQVYLGWNGDTQRLYFAIERVDDVYINAFDGTGPLGPASGVYNQDSAEFLVDGDHSGGEYGAYWDCSGTDATEECFESSQQQAQQYQLIAQSLDDRLIYLVNQRKDWASLLPWADAGGAQAGEAPNHSVIEGYVTPWDELSLEGPERSRASQLAAGRFIGFQVSLLDFDEQPGKLHAYFTVEGQSEAWHLADRFVDGLLLSCPDGDCSQAQGSAVVPDSWARIKATFR
ncbi:MAG: hypothetical protein WDA75_13070 [Candidatus Latescibacterota bacterium]|jgi:hypothetical protein